MRFILALLIVLCPPVFAAEITGQFDNGITVTLTDEPCTNAVSVALIRPDILPRFHAGSARFPNRTIQLCWALLPDNERILLVDEEGDVGPVPIGAFAPPALKPGI